MQNKSIHVGQFPIKISNADFLGVFPSIAVYSSLVRSSLVQLRQLLSLLASAHSKWGNGNSPRSSRVNITQVLLLTR